MSDDLKECYMVMRLMKKLTSNQKKIIEIEGMLGVVPVFISMEEAIDASENGKYKIIPITCGNLN